MQQVEKRDGEGERAWPSSEEAATIQKQTFPPSMTFQIETSLIFTLVFSSSNLIFPVYWSAVAPDSTGKIYNST